jgi:hypothetical protein
MAVLASMSAFVLGYCAVCLSQTEDLIRIKNDFTQAEINFVLTLTTSAFNLGSIFGMLMI